MSPIARSAVKLNEIIYQPTQRKLAVDIATKVSGLVGLTHYTQARIMFVETVTRRHWRMETNILQS